MQRRSRWTKSTYMGAHEWIHYDDLTFATWDRYARKIMYEGYDELRSFRGNAPKPYRYWNNNGYRYWIVGVILNRAKL
jgi:hypothetical protein